MLDTNARTLWLLIEGTDNISRDFGTYPCWGGNIQNICSISSKAHLVELNRESSLQLVGVSRFSKKIKCLYLRLLEKLYVVDIPPITVTDERHILLSDDTISEPPLNGIILLLSEVDGFVDVADKDGLVYRRSIKAGEELCITALARGNTIAIHQRLDIVRTITIVRLDKEKT